MVARRIAVAALVASFVFVLSCSDGFPPEFPAPDFSLKSPLTGKEAGLSLLKGKPLIIYWFTSW